MTAPGMALTAELGTDLASGLYQLVARNGQELATAHAKMIEWAVMMQATVTAERSEQESALEIAESNNWATSTFKNRIRVLDSRLLFYSKIEAALRMGYVIVPNFAMNIFAIRTKAKTPKGNAVSSTGYRPRQSFTQTAQLLPIGEGEYRDQRPLIESSSEVIQKDGKDVTQYTEVPIEMGGVEFPIAMAKPEIMDAGAAAMADKLFDEIGIAQDWNVGRGDPILLGRLRNPRSGRPSMTFFLGWYFDPSRL